MTSLTADRAPATVHAPASPGAFRTLAEIVTLAATAVRAAHAYERAGSAAARNRVLDDFASGRRAA